ncbi:hypothetical protein [Actinomadura sp. HBU206391]|uniref:hypothetical protein n=1 Tax=Actinomadura sp. HBU206391 TaxID=2731692 RepID=UPI0016508FD1|nr:hypothetical protein [Actinomadura sp. HBU206391]MBC6459179.1 hypothetical protein [Actinomadura sp. HBU206391]
MSTDAVIEDKPRRSFLEAWYGLLLRTYPPGYRDAHGAELVGTLMEASAAGRRIPSLRETTGLAVAGFTARARRAADGPTRWWADGLHLGVLILAVVNLAYAFTGFTGAGDAWVGSRSGWIAGSVALVLLLLRGWVLAALPLALAAVFGVSRQLMFDVDALDRLPFYAPVYSNWVSLTPYWMLAAGVVVLAAQRSLPLRTRSWWWVAVPIVALVFARLGLAGYWGFSSVWTLARAGLEGGLLLAGVWATAVARSPRWVLAAAVYLLPGMAVAGDRLSLQPRDPLDTIYWAVLAVLLSAMAVTAYRARAEA